MSIVDERERAYALRREVGITARQDVFPALRQAKAALEEAKEGLAEALDAPHEDPLIDLLRSELASAVTGLENAVGDLTNAKGTVNQIVHYPIP